ncbi:MAG: cytochrome ubiquinol oxidase subunit I [Chlamydiia bacterium]|nr:cytochrome ubiquinol oxidase subunit I [Chlamydiia bacterium]MCP5508839.1 cytochrome ubiquinol oxidase subunit I [Chlamydiales bacterium]
MDVLTLSRIQFGLNSAFHYIYPPMSIGLGLLIVIMEGIYMKTKNQEYKRIAQFWTKVFALTFALGVATGLVQLFAFGNNWSRYSRFVGDVFGSALGAEGIFAFFLEAGFIGLMLFGWDRVKPKVHYLSTICVAAGAHFSAVWIVIANSWMQTPTGYKIIGEGQSARAVVTDFWGMIFNPSAMQRLSHVIIGCWLTGAFLVLSVAAYYLLKSRHVWFAKKTMKVGLWISAIALVLQLISADSTARGVAEHQPEKLAAIEGVYQTEEHTPMTLIGYVDTKTQTVKGIKVPGLLSFLCFHNFKKAVPGLKEFPQTDWPNTAVVFQTYHIMIYMWFGMALATFLAWFFYRRGTLEKSKWTLRFLVVGVAFPMIANQTGWFTAEMGRQPWVVYHLLRTADGVSKSIVAGQVIGSLTMFSCLYTLLLALFLFLLNRKIKHGPGEDKVSDAIYRDPYAENKEGHA